MIALLLAASAIAGSISLSDALDQALRSNLELEQQRLDLKAAQWGVTQARGAFDPSLSIGTDYGVDIAPSNWTDDAVEAVTTTSSGWSTGVTQPLPGGGSASLVWAESHSDTNSAARVLTVYGSDSASIVLTQPLLQGAGLGPSQRGIRYAKLALSDQELVWRSELEQLVLDVCQAYWNLVLANENFALAEESVRTAEVHLSQTAERQTEGFAGSGDVLQVERSLGNARQGLVVAEAQVQAAESTLARLLGVPLAERVSLTPTDKPTMMGGDPVEDEALALARDRNAGWLRQAISVTKSLEALRESRNGLMPDLDLTGSLGSSGLDADLGAARRQVWSGDYLSWGLGADLSIALPMRQARAEFVTARLSHDRAQLQLLGAEQDLHGHVESAVRNVIRDRSRHELALQTLDFARRALEAEEELLREGNARASTLAVTLAVDELQSVELAELNARIDLQLSALELMRVEGVLLEELDINPHGVVPSTAEAEPRDLQE
jgi:outer membrane protein TolC